jgi:hypothetical protein
MGRYLRSIAVTCGLSVAACSSSTEIETPSTVSSGKAALAGPALAPEPYHWDAISPEEWKGTRVELAVADAWSLCARDEDFNAVSYYVLGDAYLARIKNLVSAVACGRGVLPWGEPLAHWYDMRQMLECNRSATDPTQKEQLPANLDTRLPTFNDPESTSEGADQLRSDILTPESNLCIAQKLRAMAPGASPFKVAAV